MGKLDVAILRYLSSEDFRVLTAVSLSHKFENSNLYCIINSFAFCVTEGAP